MNARLLSRILIAAGLIGLSYQTCLSLVPAWFHREVVVTRTEFDVMTQTASYSTDDRGQTIELSIEIDSDPLVPGPNDQVIVEEDGEQQEFAAKPGQSVEIGKSRYTVDVVRPWTGILPDAAGEALIEISLGKEDGPWVEDLVLNARSEVSLEALEVRFRPSTVDESVSEAAKDSISAPRWGIQEGEKTVWFDTMLPGAGAETSDGAAYTLMQYRAANTPSPGTEPAIRVSIDKNGAIENVVVTPSKHHDVIRFQVPKGESIYLTIMENGPNAVVGRLGSAELPLRTGYAVEIPGTLFRVRVDAISPSGAWVAAEQSTFYEVVLSNGGHQVQLRQGETLRINDALLWYALDASNVTQRYHVTSDLYADDAGMLAQGDTLTLEGRDGIYSSTLDAAGGGGDIVFAFRPKVDPMFVIVSIFVILSGFALRQSRATNLSSEH